MDQFVSVRGYRWSSSKDVYIRLLLLPRQDVVMYPGEIIPLKITNMMYQHHIGMLLDNKAHELPMIGIQDTDHVAIGAVGVSCQIESMKLNHFTSGSDDNDEELTGDASHTTFGVKGLFRYQILELTSESGLKFAKVLRLRDIDAVGSAYSKLQPSFHIKSIGNYTDGRPFPKWVYDIASPSNLALYVYKLYLDYDIYQEQQQENLLKFLEIYDQQNVTYTEMQQFIYLDPISFSYYLCSSLIMSTRNKRLLLEAETVVERFRLIINYFSKVKQGTLCCSNCRLKISSRSEVLRIRNQPMNAFVNSYGAIHQLVTLSSLTSNSRLFYQGRPSLRDTYFPNYAWTIAYCSRCLNHLGWKYNRVDSTGNQIMGLDEFWGFCLSSLSDQVDLASNSVEDMNLSDDHEASLRNSLLRRELYDILQYFRQVEDSDILVADGVESEPDNNSSLYEESSGVVEEDENGNESQSDDDSQYHSVHSHDSESDSENQAF